MRRHRGLVIAAAYLLFCLIYLGAPRLAVRAPLLLTPSAIDRAIPFIPATIVLYASQFAILFLALWRAEDVATPLRAIALATMVAAVAFVFLPTTIVRPPAHSSAFDLLWLFDVPTNCFPSLHVALAMIAAAFWPDRRWRPAAIAWAALIALSTLTTKQHYAIDVVAGGMVGAAAIVAARLSQVSVFRY